MGEVPEKKPNTNESECRTIQCVQPANRQQKKNQKQTEADAAIILFPIFHWGKYYISHLFDGFVLNNATQISV